MKRFKKLLLLIEALFFAGVFVACSTGTGGNGNINGGTSGDNNTVLCTFVEDTDETNYYVFYSDNSVEGYIKGKLEYPRSVLSYTGTPTAPGTVLLKIQGETLITFKITKNGASLVATAYIGENLMGGTKYTVKTGSSGTGGSSGNTQGSTSNAKMFMGFDNVVTIADGTDISEITTKIYSLTTDTTLKFKGGINSVTLTTVAGAIVVNDSVKIALDFSETTGITTWPNKFMGIKTLYAISLPNTIKSVQTDAFTECTNLRAITVPCSIQSYPSVPSYSYSTIVLYSTIVNFTGTFEDWLLSSAILPSGETLYLNGAIIELSGTVTIPDYVTKIKSRAFQNCSKITKVVIPKNVTSIGDSAFSGCSGLKAITIPDKVTSIGDSAFSGCSGLKAITIPDKVTSIGDSAFSGCTGLASITIPNNVVTIGKASFYGCTSLRKLIMADGNTTLKFVSIDKLLYGCPLETLYLGRNLSYYGDSPFSNKASLVSVEFGNSVESINGNAFKNCTGLASITICGSVTSIGERAFYNCSSLKHVIIEDGTAELNLLGDGFYLFENCPIETMYLGRNLKYGSRSYPFHVETLCSVEIGDRVTRIEAHEFCGCSGLTNITIPNSVTSIGDSAFSGCRGLANITIPNSVTSIGDSAFYGCSGLANITIPNSVTSIGHDVFSRCSGLANITIPDSVTSIGHDVFWECSGLKSIALGNGVKSIESVFGKCTELTSITIPDSVTSIASYAFSTCTALTTVNYRGSEEQWSAINIGNNNTPLMNATIIYNYTGD